MPFKALTYAQIRVTAASYNRHASNMGQMSKELGLTRSTIENRIREGQRRYPKLFKSFTRATGGIPKQEKPAQTISEHVQVHRAVTDASLSRARLKDATKAIADLEDKLKDMEWAAKASFKPAEWTLTPRTDRKREHMPYLLTSDFQAGEVIRPEETEAGYGYNSEIFRQRYRRMIDTTIYLSFNHGGQGWTYPGIIYSRGGDTISGGIHEELQDTDDMTPIEAVECVFEEESAGITKLAQAFGKVDVKTPGSAGNHDRNTHKPRTKTASAHSYDRLIAYMLRRHFNKDSRVQFQTSESFDVRFPIYKRNIILTHGDRMGSSGGQGFIGPMATIMRGAQKVIMEQAALGFQVDEVHHGHFHTPGYLGWVMSNGCLPGYSEYAKQYRMRPSPPQQTLAYYHAKRGLVDLKPLTLVD